MSMFNFTNPHTFSGTPSTCTLSSYQRGQIGVIVPYISPEPAKPSTIMSAMNSQILVICLIVAICLGTVTRTESVAVGSDGAQKTINMKSETLDRMTFQFSGDVGRKCYQCFTNRFSNNPPCCRYCRRCINSRLRKSRRDYCRWAVRQMRCR